MTATDGVQSGGFLSSETWDWWQARRLRYNLTLAAGGWVAYGTAAALNYAFGHSLWKDWREALGGTIFLGAGFLVVMGLANVCYLLGPAIEAWLKPADVGRYRKTAFSMGLWGSLAVPALFPLVQLGVLIANK
jgi:hypothetical protein